MRALGTLAEGDRPSKHKWPWEASQATGDGDGVTCRVRWGEVGWKEWNSGENQGQRTGVSLVPPLCLSSHQSHSTKGKLRPDRLSRVTSQSFLLGVDGKVWG